eukprot:TRINITY_DN3895_c0_g1_i1.p1 TRINITY_DN3895_c0_g1~~TRINITY_DN3895_c0_g1_i1.p1  ORF type:complete len:282 (+),score=67.04 TRINITY_DN3895_c0_g1_i1:42-848(+)
MDGDETAAVAGETGSDGQAFEQRQREHSRGRNKKGAPTSSSREREEEAPAAGALVGEAVGGASRQAERREDEVNGVQGNSQGNERGISGRHGHSNSRASGGGVSGLSAQHVIYELRVYSLEEKTFGEVLVSRAVRAAHCLTSIQFSPTSTHILLAYGRRHNSLLRSLVADGTNIVPVYTILEVYRVADMSLVRVLPSADDEVNVACFHPKVGGGLVYGTKEGRLRILQHSRVGSAALSAGGQSAGRGQAEELQELEDFNDSGISNSGI